MIFTRRTPFARDLICMLLMTFSVSVYAIDKYGIDTGIYIDGWSDNGGQNIPIISFEDVTIPEALAKDIRVENIIQESDGSTRFQLSHIGPLSRQIFANVHRISQDDGMTRSIITNIADGQQFEYLTVTSQLAAIRNGDPVKDDHGAIGFESVAGQKAECLFCVAYYIYKVACSRAETRFFQQCHSLCQSHGGVEHVDVGSCGVQGECVCMAPPPKDSRKF